MKVRKFSISTLGGLSKMKVHLILCLATYFIVQPTMAEMTFQGQYTVVSYGGTLDQAEGDYPKVWQNRFKALERYCESISSYAEKVPYNNPGCYPYYDAYECSGWFWARCWRK